MIYLLLNTLSKKLRFKQILDLLILLYMRMDEKSTYEPLILSLIPWSRCTPRRRSKSRARPAGHFQLQYYVISITAYSRCLIQLRSHRPTKNARETPRRGAATRRLSDVLGCVSCCVLLGIGFCYAMLRRARRATPLLAD